MENIKFKIMEAHQLDPSKVYLIELNKVHTPDEVHRFGEELKKLGLRGMFIVKSDDQEVKITEIDPQKPTTTHKAER